MKLTNIQLLRFLAAASVLVFHLGIYAQLTLGFSNQMTALFSHTMFSVGVQVFFAISGYVLARSLVGGSTRTFLLRRLLRLYPAYLIAALGALLIVPYPFPLSASDPAVWRGMTLLPFGTNQVLSPLLIEWTLVYELAFSVALVGFALISRRWGVVVGCGLWLILCLGKLIVEPSSERVMLPLLRQLPFAAPVIPFLLGVFAYHARAHTFGLRYWGPIVTLAFIVAAYLLPPEASQLRPDLFFTLVGVGCSVFVWWTTVIPQVSAQNWLVWMGDRSYGIYLVHVSVLLILFTFAKEIGFATMGTVLGVGLLALMLGLIYGEFDVRLYGRLRSLTEQGGALGRDRLSTRLLRRFRPRNKRL